MTDFLLAAGLAALFGGLLWMALSYEEYEVKKLRGVQIVYQPRWRVSTPAVATTLLGAAIVAFTILSGVV